LRRAAATSSDRAEKPKENIYELRNYRLRQDRPRSCQGVCPQGYCCVRCNREPESFASDAAAIGPEITSKTPAEAFKAEVIFLAVHFEAHPGVVKALPTWQGKTIIDVTNAYGVPSEELGAQPSSKFVAQAFTGGRLVKGFNHLVAAVLDQDPAVHGGRRVVLLASDDDGAAAEIGALAENLGFAPIKLGGLSEGGLLVQARGNSWDRLIFKDLIKFD
jgi:8-hydroxy-5-deazaflavin:NADPH oxidoreductase